MGTDIPISDLNLDVYIASPAIKNLFASIAVKRKIKLEKTARTIGRDIEAMADIPTSRDPPG